jgi:hypothetical protein
MKLISPAVKIMTKKSFGIKSWMIPEIIQWRFTTNVHNQYNIGHGYLVFFRKVTQTFLAQYIEKPTNITKKQTIHWSKTQLKWSNGFQNNTYCLWSQSLINNKNIPRCNINIAHYAWNNTATHFTEVNFGLIWWIKRSAHIWHNSVDPQGVRFHRGSRIIERVRILCGFSL